MKLNRADLSNVLAAEAAGLSALAVMGTLWVLQSMGWGKIGGIACLVLEYLPLVLKPCQRCHQCWQVDQKKRKKLSDRRHTCRFCGTSCSRDENAAWVLWRWAEEQICGREPAEAWREVRPADPLDEPALP